MNFAELDEEVDNGAKVLMMDTYDRLLRLRSILEYEENDKPIPKHELFDSIDKLKSEYLDVVSEVLVGYMNLQSKKDKARVSYLLNQQNAAPPVPPNFALQDGVKVLENKIVFGADVTNIKKEDCPEPISRTKLKETLIKNRLAS